MPKVRLLGGKPLIVGGKVALSDSCCCGAGTCPDVDPITVAFSGISLCSGCLDATPFGFGVSINNLIATGVINGTFTLARYFTGSPEGWFFTTGNRINYDLWTASGCSGPPFSNVDDGLTPIVWCENGVWQVWLLTNTNGFSLFYATTTGVPSGAANIGVCGATTPDPVGGVGSPDFVIGSGGTATVTV